MSTASESLRDFLVHQEARNEVYLCGGMCVDEGAYRLLPKPLFAAVRSGGGFATIVTRDSIAMPGDAPAVFGHVGVAFAT